MSKYTTQMLIKQRTQGLQAFVFCIVTINDKHTEPRFKRNLAVIFAILPSQDGFESDCPESKFETIHF